MHYIQVYGVLGTKYFTAVTTYVYDNVKSIGVSCVSMRMDFISQVRRRIEQMFAMIEEPHTLWSICLSL